MKETIQRIIVSLILTLAFFHSIAQHLFTRVAYEYAYQQGASINTQKKSAPVKTSYEKYDSNGNIIEEDIYIAWERAIQLFQQSNNITFINHGAVPEQKHFNTAKFFTYDDQQRLTEDELWSMNNKQKIALISKTFYIYNSAGTLYREIQFGEDGQVINSKTKIYARDKVITIDTGFVTYSFGRIVEESRDTIIIDELQRIAEQIHYVDGKFIYRNKYLYGSRTLKELSFHTKKDSLSVITQFYYDSQKRLLTEHQEVKDSHAKTKKVYLYDRKGRLAKTLHYTSGRRTGYIKYSYGNDAILTNNPTQSAIVPGNNKSNAYKSICSN
ncbi:hypothetical protein BH10BAC2_BH10BAC2_11090 [soil metagenome]